MITEAVILAELAALTDHKKIQPYAIHQYFHDMESVKIPWIMI
jgi:hypothetical protein